MFRALTLSLAITLTGCGVAPHFAPQAVGNQPSRAAARNLPVIGAERFTQVDENLYRLGLPSDADMQTLAKLGIKTDITLQSDYSNEAPVVKHEKEVAKSLGMTVLHLPLPFKENPPKAMTDQFLAVFDDPARLPAMVHCRHGRDRTGTMVALYRMAKLGWSNERAFTEMKTFGFQEKDYPYFAQFVKNYGKGHSGAFVAL